MAAGLGFKTFTTGEVLTAADVNGYLMQGVLVFASEAARNSAITSPQEGQFAFTKDTNSLWYYSGSAWVASGATGDIEGVTAGTGISGGGTSGTVTITNSMATAIDAKGDLVAGTGADTFSRLAVGANGTVLTADSAETTGLKWQAASSGALTLITQASFDNPNVSVSNCFSTTYENYLILINCHVANSTLRQVFLRFLDSGGSEYSSNNYFSSSFGYKTSGSVLEQTQSNGVAQINFPLMRDEFNENGYFQINLLRRASTNGVRPSFTGTLFSNAGTTDSNAASYTIGGTFNGDTNTVYGFKFYNGTYNVKGQYRVYGYAKT